ncbi:MAG: hypothetical protein ACRDNF_05910 [Streptosporangiaceae bacterium]
MRLLGSVGSPGAAACAFSLLVAAIRIGQHPSRQLHDEVRQLQHGPQQDEIERVQVPDLTRYTIAVV